MRKKQYFTKGLTALVISTMLATTPAVSHLAYADSGAATEGTTMEATEEPETEVPKEQENEELEEKSFKDTEKQNSEDTEKQDIMEKNPNNDDEQNSENEEEQNSKAAEEFKTNIAKLKAYEDKLESLTSEDAAAIQELINAISDYLDANEEKLTSEIEDFLNTFTEKFNDASLKTVEEVPPIELMSINAQIKEGDKNNTIEITADTTEDVVIPEGYSIKLKIAADVTLSNKEGSTITVENGGFLSIDGDGTIENDTKEGTALEIKAGGKAVIYSGAFVNSIRLNADADLTVKGILAVDNIIAEKGARLTLLAGPEKASDAEYSYAFLGWFDQKGNTPDKPEDLEEGELYKYTPAYLSSKIESNDSSADTAESPDKTRAILDDSARAVINKILGKNGEDVNTQLVEYDAEKDNVTEELKKALADNGTSIITKLELAVAKPPQEISNEINKASDENSWKVSDFFVNIDINMYTAQGEQEEKVARITEVNREVDFSIAIPEELRSKNNNYAVARYHGGKVDILDADKSEDGKSVIFKSNLFSYFGLLYQEIKTSDNTDDKNNDSNNNNNSSTARSSSSGGSSTTANNGTWMMDNTGWWFKKSDGSYPKDAWYECIWNGTSNWYHFNAQGYADGGWLTDKDGQKYYLHNLHDGKFGYMYTGWNQINGQWYYFNTANIATGLAAGGHSKGSLVTNATTADGYKVGADGTWIK